MGPLPLFCRACSAQSTTATGSWAVCTDALEPAQTGVNKCLFPDSAAPVEEIIPAAAFCCCCQWCLPLGAPLIHSAGKELACSANRDTLPLEQTLLTVARRGSSSLPGLTEGQRDSDTVLGTAATPTATGGGVTSHKKLCPNDGNSLSCLPRFESRLNCHDGNTEAAQAVLAAGALWGLALKREQTQVSPRAGCHCPHMGACKPPWGP